MTIADRARSVLFRRSLAYRQCFCDDKGNLTPAGRIVLADLAKFSALLDGPAVVSPVQRVTDVPATMQRLGRGDVVRRVWQYLHLPINKLFETIREEADNE